MHYTYIYTIYTHTTHMVYMHPTYICTHAHTLIHIHTITYAHACTHTQSTELPHCPGPWKSVLNSHNGPGLHGWNSACWTSHALALDDCKQWSLTLCSNSATSLPLQVQKLRSRERRLTWDNLVGR